MREEEGRGRQLKTDGGNPGSIPGESTNSLTLSARGGTRKVAGYGLPGRFAKPCGLWAVRVRIPCLPLTKE